MVKTTYSEKYKTAVRALVRTGYTSAKVQEMFEGIIGVSYAITEASALQLAARHGMLPR